MANKPMNKNFLKGAGIGAFILALVIGVITYKSYEAIHQFSSDGIKTTATITRVSETVKTKEASRNIVLDVNFFTQKEDNSVGDLISTQLTDFGFDEKWYNEKEVDLYYLKSNPKDAIIESQYGNYNIVYAGLAICILMLLLAFLVFKKAKKQEK